jgi:hypothetical protein
MLSPKAAAFERLHAANPAIYDTLVSLAREWVRRCGSRRLGVKALFERLRWAVPIESDDAEYLLNNTWAPWYARLIAIQEADLRDVFELRPHAMTVRRISPGRD